MTPKPKLGRQVREMPGSKMQGFAASAYNSRVKKLYFRVNRRAGSRAE